MGDIYGPSYVAARRGRFQFAESRCEVCKHDGSVRRLEAHHAGGAECYERDRRNELTLEDLVILCVGCHEAITDRDRRERYAAVEIRLVETTGEASCVPQPSARPPLAVIRIPLHVDQKPNPTR